MMTIEIKADRPVWPQLVRNSSEWIHASNLRQLGILLPGELAAMEAVDWIEFPDCVAIKREGSVEIIESVAPAVRGGVTIEISADRPVWPQLVEQANASDWILFPGGAVIRHEGRVEITSQ